jgi:hypothetical protein
MVSGNIAFRSVVCIILPLRFSSGGGKHWGILPAHGKAIFGYIIYRALGKGGDRC